MFVEPATASVVINMLPCFGLKTYCFKRRFSRVGNNVRTPPDPFKVNEVTYGNKLGPLNDAGNNKRYLIGINVTDDDKSSVLKFEEKLEPLWDDGYGTQSVKDYMDLAKDIIIKPDGGPPRWFCPVISDGNDTPLPDSPVLLFLPDIDGLGLSLVLHQKSLRKVFEVRCLHIPVYDRTPFEDIVTFVEETLRYEHALFPSRPIYLVGDSFGGCLALAVAARNPTIDLVLIISNPATSFDRTQLQPVLPILELIPDSFDLTIPYLVSTVILSGDPIKMAMVNAEGSRFPNFEKLSNNFTSLLPRLQGLSDIITKATLSWKLKLLKSGAAYANSRLHDVKAEVLVLASGKDNLLPSRDEAQRLSKELRNCKICYYRDNGHTLLLEDGINLLTVIKGKSKYRRSWKHDFVNDYLPPSISEYRSALQVFGWFLFATSPVMFSTLEDGRIVRGLSGVPDDGPVLLVGYHNLMGLELAPLVYEFLREKNAIVRGMAHPEILRNSSISNEFSFFDIVKIFGALPATPSNLFKLFSSKSFSLLYPGGAREALHRKGEKYKLFWPDQPEFVRMAAKFGATIVPFGAVGGDDLAELALDYDDMMKIPVLNDYIRKQNEEGIRLRTEMEGEVANQDLYFPGIMPKVPGRFYYKFGKPIRTEGRKKMLKDRENAKEVYMEIKSEVENSLAYLIKKRDEDPYRGVVNRIVNQTYSTQVHQVPSFEP